MLKEPQQHARERERDFDDVSAALGEKKTSKKPKKESNDEKVQHHQTRERERNETHTRVHKLVFEIFVVSFAPHFGWTRDPLGNERRGKEGTRIVVIYKHTYTHRHTHTHKRERERA